MVLSRQMGARVRRKEDPRLITGSSTYVEDIYLPGMLHLAFVRSPYAHANVNAIDTSEATRVPGVVAVFTAADLRKLLKPMKDPGKEVEAPTYVDDDDWPEPELFQMVSDRVRHVGEAVACVVADTQYAARDGVDAVVVVYDPLPTITDLEASMRDGAPQLYDEFPNNICYRWSKKRGDVDRELQSCPVMVRERILNNRVAGVPMETRGVLATPDPINGALTFWTSTQAPHWNRQDVAESMGVPEAQVRTIAPQVGGGFGVKIGSYPEDYIISAVAYKLGRPVKWIETRAENFIATHHGRAQIADVEVSAEKNGKITAYRLRVIQDQGSYPKDTGLSKLTGRMAVGCYDIPNIDIETVGVLTNTMDVGAYRGAGRPEAAFYIERVMDLVAQKVGLDPAEVRRINFIPPFNTSHVVSTGERYDTGDYEKPLNKALEASGYQELRRQQEEARKQGRYLGIGLSSYVEICGFGPYESSTVRVERGGDVTVYSGIMPQGQGQETTFAQIVSDELGVPMDNIHVRFGDTNSVPQGNGSMGSRGLAVGGGALMKSTQKVRDKARRIAAHMLEASFEDIEIGDGKYRVAGAPDRATTLRDIAQLAYEDADDLPDEIDAGLESTDFFRPGDETFPFGTHVAVVEVLPETGEVKLLRYVAIDDCGPRISPMLVEGQVHGGLAQGIAQALIEDIAYDESGQLLSGTLMDYAIPKAALFPMFETGQTETTTPINPLGAKGIGEAATIGATPAIANAVVDALKPFGITHVDIPFRAQRIWSAINEARG